MSLDHGRKPEHPEGAHAVTGKTWKPTHSHNRTWTSSTARQQLCHPYMKELEKDYLDTFRWGKMRKS